MITLRPNQEKLLCDLRQPMRDHRAVAAIAATGFGKTPTLAAIASRAVARGKRVLITAHLAEIVDQISTTLDRFGLRHGRIQPSHSMTDDLAQVAMIQTAARRIARMDAPDLLIVDECHHVVSSTYRRIIDAWPNALVLGFTATPARLDGRGLGDIFKAMVVGPQTRELIDAGLLADYVYLAPPTRIDLSGVKTRMGDYAIDDLAAAMDKAVITGSAVEAYRKYLAPRAAIAFCVSISHAEHTAEQFREAGFRAASVDGTMAKPERRNLLASIGDGRLNVLTSCSLIAEGVDIPTVGGVILLRPTQSLAAYLQSIGRALRVKPDGSKAVILDHVNNIGRHGMPDAPREWSLKPKKKRDSADPIAQCEQCFRVFAVSPGWRKYAECGEDDRPEGCILNTPEPAEKPLPEQVDGELIIVTNTPAWACGINLATARGPDFGELLDLADTEEKLRQVARVRGYHHGWTSHVMKRRAPARRGAA